MNAAIIYTRDLYDDRNYETACIAHNSIISSLYKTDISGFYSIIVVVISYYGTCAFASKTLSSVYGDLYFARIRASK